jgi:hypothetical protein
LFAENKVCTYAGTSPSTGDRIPFVIMTSEGTHERVKKLLSANDYYGMHPNQIHIFQQVNYNERILYAYLIYFHLNLKTSYGFWPIFIVLYVDRVDINDWRLHYLFTCALRSKTSIRHCSGILIGFIMIDLHRTTRYLCICLDRLVCGNSSFLSLLILQLWKVQIEINSSFLL